MNDVRNAASFLELTADNFTILAEEIAKRVATYQNGNPTTVIGPPVSGTRVLNEFWRDVLGGEWVCTVAGTPGTWIQIRPAAVTAAGLVWIQVPGDPASVHRHSPPRASRQNSARIRVPEVGGPMTVVGLPFW